MSCILLRNFGNLLIFYNVFVVCISQDVFGNVWGWCIDNELGQESQKQQVEKQVEVVDVSATGVPFVPDQCHAEGVTQ